MMAAVIGGVTDVNLTSWSSNVVGDRAQDMGETDKQSRWITATPPPSGCEAVSERWTWWIEYPGGAGSSLMAFGMSAWSLVLRAKGARTIEMKQKWNRNETERKQKGNRNSPETDLKRWKKRADWLAAVCFSFRPVSDLFQDCFCFLSVSFQFHFNCTRLFWQFW